VGNPPFKGKTYISFLNLAYEISNKYVIFIHPSMVYLNHREVIRRDNELNFYSISNKIKDIKLFHASDFFKNIALLTPMAMTYIDKDKNTNEIKIEDKVLGTFYKVSNIKDINLFNGDQTLFASLKTKIVSKADISNIHTHKFSEGEYFVNVAKLRGNTTNDGSKWLNDNFYTFFQKSTEVTKIKNQLYYGFKTEFEASNFLNYLKSDLARFSLALNKTSMMQQGSELYSVPWLDFSQEWTNEKLYEHFKLTQEEINFIKTNIPKYYE
jgi:hypothetical protein